MNNSIQYEYEKEYAQLTNKLRITLAGHKNKGTKVLIPLNLDG
jgi:hypothetical protein